MRVIAGQWKGRTLRPPPGPGTRPILDQVKEALFNILGSRLASPGTLPELRVLDLFCGTGTLGLEALSRGAAHCVFFERDRATAVVLRQNIASLEAEAVSDVRVRDIWRLQPQRDLGPASFDLVFLDPPYADAAVSGDGPLPQLLQRLHGDGCVMDGIVVLRHPRKITCSQDSVPQWHIFEQRTYGGMTLTLLRPHELS